MNSYVADAVAAPGFAVRVLAFSRVPSLCASGAAGESCRAAGQTSLSGACRAASNCSCAAGLDSYKGW